MSPADRWAAYTSTLLYLATPSGVLHVTPAQPGRTTGEFPTSAGQAIHVITAYNPGGTVLSPGENAAAQASLEAELSRRQIPRWPAAGANPDSSHVEASVAVIGLDTESALELGRSYGQEAIFKVTADGRFVIACHDRRGHASGWIIEPAPDKHPDIAGALQDVRHAPSVAADQPLTPAPAEVAEGGPRAASASAPAVQQQMRRKAGRG